MLQLLHQNANFRLFWTGQTVSMVGNFVLPVALALLGAKNFGSASAVGFILGARALGTVAALLIGGVLADAWDRRRVMLWSDAVRFVACGSIVFFSGHLWAVVALALVLGIGEGLFYPAYNMYAIDLVDDNQLQAANSLNAFGQRIAAVVAPAAAAGLAAVIELRWLFAVDAVSFLVAGITLYLVRPQVSTILRESGQARASKSEHPGLKLRAVFSGIKGGFSEVTRRRWVGLVILQDALNSGVVYAPVTVLLPVILLGEGFSASAYAMVTAASAVGSVLGALIASRVKPRLPGLAASLIALPYGFYVLAVAGGGDLWLLVGLAVVSSCGREVGLVLWYTSLQRDVPRSALSRVNSIDWLGSMSLMPIGHALTGSIAVFIATDTLLYAAAVLFAVITVTPLINADVRAFRTLKEPKDAMHEVQQ